RRSRGIVYLVRNPAYFAGVSQYIPGIQKKVVTFANTADGGGGSGTLPVAAVSGIGIPAADGLYTNLGLLVSDQCQHSSKLAVVWTVKIVLFPWKEPSLWSQRSMFALFWKICLQN